MFFVFLVGLGVLFREVSGRSGTPGASIRGGVSEMAKRHWKTMDENAAAAHVAYAFSEVAAIYPITPSLIMPDANRLASSFFITDNP